ncbi:MAG: hypothetical protein AUJ32_00650 [Parcubacteria group bacterium CG1_02_40_82]|uniref:Uncharacterized protein n=3 Tax=Candidatus Portnoyibacteriota TaxID=1817913 RepID=A0A2M7IHM6_9BACT|nr:MAG: hypothetical protein AUJ32_00650 [Parcubacteria group bacterium CG1_02_40_82]PIQ75343.1 MAG: hypothetical protein COV84_01660 [Candidatus Portnoybacteria bacterium CG11_big_fil_rev_8_21_14_0_20_40_15]PIS31331.1 MAG: hypothetical protein COT41_02090 [Candidatus Portnoybacteria bacterium CG08_land_8_20_14_0_20_40_83]PIW76036.1 MAG: hypothetical protein CO001_03455 [Candidatus Portnoybacteria bacterium CG_4_8_14_3_um_filter_40_10]PIY74708.1 MAG: hypothetical protein COY85_02450 [Candidatus
MVSDAPSEERGGLASKIFLAGENFTLLKIIYRDSSAFFGGDTRARLISLKSPEKLSGGFLICPPSLSKMRAMDGRADEKILTLLPKYF